MTAAGLEYSREHEMKVHHRGVEIGSRRVNFFVEDKIIVELKAVSALDDLHLAINYLEAYGLEVGLLITFGARILDFKRVMKPKEL